MNYFRFANVMNNRTIINFFNSDNSNIDNILRNKTVKSCPAVISYRISKFESMIKKPLVANHTFFTSTTFSRISSFAYINSIVI